MFAHATAPSSPTVSSNPPTRPRLRGLSYLRSYTQNHLSLHSQQPLSPTAPRNSLFRSTSTPLQPSSSQDLRVSPTSPSVFANGWPSTIGANNGTSSSTSKPLPGPPRLTHRGSAEEVITEGEGLPQRMARKRSGSSQPGPQAQAARRGQSVPTYSTIQDNRSRLARIVSSAAEANVDASTTGPVEPSGLTGLPQDQMPTIKFIPHQDPRSGKPSLTFATTSRTLPHQDCVIRVGRYSERDAFPNPPANVPSAAPVGFKSKVVSRRHCEFWCSQGQWYIKDVKSSSGTFLNHIRLSQPSIESRPFPLNDGDVVQLGIDFRGGEEMIFRCVKIRVECNRAWQKGLNNFNMTTHRQLRALAKAKKDSDATSTHSSECAICLMSIAPCQSLFVAPCSHVWHYKCIRPMLNDQKTWPQFMCPNCRAMADLEADVDDPLDDWDDEEEFETRSDHGIEQIPPDLNGVDLGLDDGQLMDDVLDQDLASSTSYQLRVSQHRVDSDEDPYNYSPARLPSTSSAPSLRARRLASHSDEQPSVSAEDDHATEQDEAEDEDGDLYVDPANTPSWPEDDRSNRPNGPPRLATPPASMSLRANLSSAVLLETLPSEGPLTPRNDVGPFVFDGSAGRIGDGGRRAGDGSGGQVESNRDSLMHG